MSAAYPWQNPVFRHLRFPFSWFLLPAFLMGWLMVPDADTERVWQLGLVLHLLVYPSSNAFNSWQDRDEGPIGGMERPPQAPDSLRWWSLAFDMLAVGLCSYWWWPLGLGVLAYILASRAYSWRQLRLKKYPWPGFFTVVLFQGPWVMLLCAAYLPKQPFVWEQLAAPGLWYAASALVLGGTYPLTQVYQHAADKADGVLSLSAWLGIQGTFRFSAAAFAAAGPFLLLPLWMQANYLALALLMLALLPTLWWFFSWWKKVQRDETAANFKNTMVMNVVASSTLNVALLLIGGLGI
jgi:1,4-dihydroxy-2-naphthoate octaprenyltransferase